KHSELYGNPDTPDDTLVWFAPSAVMNPKLPASVVERALAENAPKARAEYLNIWREDLDDVFPVDAIDQSIDRGVHERAPMPNRQCHAYVDAAGGTSTDSFGFAISHREPGPDGPSYVLDLVREYKPCFVPPQVIAELVEICRRYNIREVTGD